MSWIGYKVVKNIDGRYYSWHKDSKKIEYVPDVFVDAPENIVDGENLYLFIFTELDLARRMPDYRAYPDMEIWKIEFDGYELIRNTTWPSNCRKMAKRVKLIERMR